MNQEPARKNKLVSVIVPAYNEGPNIDTIYGAITELFDRASFACDLELIFSDNASRDDTYERIRRLATSDRRVKGLRLSRNFGFQANILAAMMNATGDCVVQIDADGEDPPALIEEFVRYWNEGYDVVYGIRISRHESFFLTLQRKLFYRVLSRMASIDMPVDAGDFRLMDRRVVDLLCRRFTERNPYLRGLVSYIGFRQRGVTYERGTRAAGQSKFSRASYLTLAWDAVTSFSRTPLKIMAAVGFAMATLSCVGIVFFLTVYLFGKVHIRGFTSTILLLLLLSGIQLFSLGILGEYISRVFDEVKQRPRMIVDQYCGFTEPPLDG